MDKKVLLEQFEKTKTYDLCKSWQIDFDDSAGIYYSINPAYHSDVVAINAAWRMFQEEQAKVEELEKEWLEMNQQHEQAVKECFEANTENRKLQKKVEEMQNKFIEQGLICPMCGITEPKEDSFLNGDIECLISVCKECGIETASKPQMKINKLTNLNAELQKRVDSIREVLDELQEQADVIRKRGQKFQDSTFLASADMMEICIKELEQALKGEG